MHGILTAVFCLFLCYASGAKGPEVEIQQGRLLGKWLKTHSGRQIAAFQGIPYAKPPIGNLRFKAPQKPEPWLGVWNATNFGTLCVQISPTVQTQDVVIGTEDCLFVNVYKPEDAKEDDNLPVVVFIHGGAFMFGSGDYYLPTHLLEKDVVFVTFNYRLNVFGFLSTEDEASSGNWGLKDQSAALHWVANNIHKFGGDQKSITLTGLSAGGASVNYQMLSPLSKGTFQRAWSISGATTCPWTLTKQPLERARALASYLGCPVKDTEQLVECLKRRPSGVLIEATRIFHQWRSNLFSPFTPVIEPTNLAETFLTKHPYQAITEGDYTHVPWIGSVTTEEGLYPAADHTSDELLADLEANWEKLGAYFFVYEETLDKSQHKTAAKKIKEYYMKGEPISSKTFSQLVQAMGDRFFVVDVQKAAHLHAATSKHPVYFYQFRFRGNGGSLSDSFSGSNENYGVSHGDDVFTLLETPFLNPAHDDDTLKMTEMMVDFLYTFATTNVPKFGSKKFEPVNSSKNLTYMEITSPTEYAIKKSDDLGHNKFWQTIGFKENEKLFIAAAKEEF